MYHPKGPEGLMPGPLSSLALVIAMAVSIGSVIPGARYQTTRFLKKCFRAVSAQQTTPQPSAQTFEASTPDRQQATSSALFLPSPAQSPPAPLPPAPAPDRAH